MSKVDKITIYGEGNSAKLLANIVNGTAQVTEGISALGGNTMERIKNLNRYQKTVLRIPP